MQYTKTLLIALLLSFACSTWADRYLPTRMTRHDYYATLYNDASRTFVALSADPARTWPRLIGYHSGKRKFAVEFKGYQNVDLCALSAHDDVVVRRGTADGACFLSIVSGRSGAVRDLAAETDLECRCSQTAINENGKVAELRFSRNLDIPADSPAPIAIRIYDDSASRTFHVPEALLPTQYWVDSIKAVGLSNSNVLAWQDDTSLTAFDLSSRYKKYEARELHQLFPSLKHYKQNSFYWSPLSLKRASVIMRGTGERDAAKKRDELIRLNLFSGKAHVLAATPRQLYRYDPEVRFSNYLGNDPSAVIQCSLSPKDAKKVNAFNILTVLPNGDIYTGTHFLKRRKTAVAMPYCYNAVFTASKSCEHLFTSTTNIDLRFGLVGDQMLFPSYDAAQRYHQCEVVATLIKMDGSPLANRSLLLDDNRGNKTSVATDAHGEVRFRVTIDTFDGCYGPSHKGPYADGEVLPLVKPVWGVHCV